MYILIKKFEKGITKGIDTSMFGKNTDDLLLHLLGSQRNGEPNKKGGVDWFIIPTFKTFNYKKFLDLGAQYSGGTIIDLNDNLKFLQITEDFKLNTVSVIKRVAKELETVYELQNGVDFEIIAEAKWRHDDMNFRISLSDKMLKKPPLKEGVPSYAELVSHVLNLGVPYYEYGDLNVIYFPAIAEEHMFVYEDENLYIEEKKL